MMLKVILELHVSILLNHLQALVFLIHTKNALHNAKCVLCMDQKHEGLKMIQ